MKFTNPKRYDKNMLSYRLYLVSDQRVLQNRNFLKSIEEALKGGVTMLQLREKDATSKAFYTLALETRKLTDRYNVPLIINDRVDIALAVDAAGVHLGQQDLPVSVARELLGPGKILGASTATLAEAKKAEAQGADYIGVGALFPTETKNNTRKVTLDQLRTIKEQISIPVVGIGGIHEKNISSVLSTDIDGVAVVSAILGKEDIETAAKDLTKFYLHTGGNHS